MIPSIERQREIIDIVYNQGTKPPFLSVTQESGVYVARMTLGIA